MFAWYMSVIPFGLEKRKEKRKAQKGKIREVDLIFPRRGGERERERERGDRERKVGFGMGNSRAKALGFVAGIVLLTLAAEKSRQLVGDATSSKSGQFTWINCFDMGTGSLACIGKEAVKLYVYNIRAAHVEGIKQKEFQIAYANALTETKDMKAVAKQAQQAAEKAGKLASRKARRITGPIVAGGWDLFEALYYGGTLFEGCLRGLGTVFGTYIGGFQGEQYLGRVGYLIGSQLGNWVGGRVGLMVYDITNGVEFLLFQSPFEATSESYQSEPNYEEPSELTSDSYQSEPNYEEPSELTSDSYQSEPNYEEASEL